jgi:hypothetical protein
VAALGLLLVPGVAGAREILERRDDLPEAVGRALAAHTAPGDLVLTNFNCSPLLPGGTGDEHVDKVLEVLWASDRSVRGLVGTAEGVGLAEALARRPGARWFLLTPWPPGALPGLAHELSGRAAGPPVRLLESPAVDLWPLAR